MMSRETKDRHSQVGFTMVELIVVVAIIAIMAGMAIPAISRFIRNYQIRGATQQVAAEITTARNRAIAKNVNLGVVFVITSPTQYRFAVEDDQAVGKSTMTGTKTTARQPVSTILAQAGQAGPVRTLPQGLEFVAPSAANCPTVTPALPLSSGALDSGMRFSRLGGWCDPGGTGEPCPALATGSNLVYNTAAGGSVICVNQTRTNMKRAITVLPGGRVNTVP
jgi:prepilin-type N-terminal cleavage/methylation domain-containing protein